MKLVKGLIDDVIVKPVPVYEDDRGFLIETWRIDENPGPDGWGAKPTISQEKADMPNFYSGPVMSYCSWTKPNRVRGLHQHERQKDHFYFVGPSTFKVVLIDARKNSETYGRYMEIFAGERNPKYVMVPEMVAHGYKNVGNELGMVLNFPDSLFKGWQKQNEKIDEIRHPPHDNEFGYTWADFDC